MLVKFMSSYFSAAEAAAATGANPLQGGGVRQILMVVDDKLATVVSIEGKLKRN